jgi:hypothetical protein
MTGRILYNNLLRNDSIVTDVSVTGFGPENAYDGRTTTFVKYNSGTNQGTTYDLGAQLSFDSLAIARHNMGANSYIKVTGSNNGVDYTNIITSYNVIYEKNIFVDLGSQSYRYVQILFSDTTQEKTMSDIFLGPSYSLDRSQKFGFTRPGLSDGDQLITNVTRGKELAGMTIKSGLDRIVFNLPYYSSAWLGEFLEFRDTMKQYPIYIIWDTSRNETPFTGGEPAFYCWPRRLPEPKYSKGIQGYYDIILDMEGFWR